MKIDGGVELKETEYVRFGGEDGFGSKNKCTNLSKRCFVYAMGYFCNL